MHIDDKYLTQTTEQRQTVKCRYCSREVMSAEISFQCPLCGVLDVTEVIRDDG